jgi:SIR2-like domain
MSSFSRAALDWEDDETRAALIAAALRSGEAGLLLGAGVSAGVGFQQWEGLVRDVAERAQVEVSSGKLSNEELLVAAERAQLKFNNRPDEWAKLVSVALYSGVKRSPEALLRCGTLRIVAATAAYLAHQSGGTDVVTLNFDDSLESMLRMFGLSTRSIADAAELHKPAQARVWHPHGCLFDDGTSKGRVTLSRLDFNTHDERQHSCANRVSVLLRERFWIIVGVSGSDDHMDKMLLAAKASHVQRDGSYWGVAFAREPVPKKSEELRAMWRARGIWLELVADFDQIESRLAKCLTLA